MDAATAHGIIGSIVTLSGREIDLMRPDDNDYDIEDIAHALAMTCRFNGLEHGVACADAQQDGVDDGDAAHHCAVERDAV